jgi:uncharacterized damage-inducible protein DinB
MNAQALAEILTIQFRDTHWVVLANLKGLADEQYFQAPQGGGNCLNWVLGHLVQARNGALIMLGQDPVIDAGLIDRYQRGSDAVTADDDAVPSVDLRSAFKRSQRGLLTGLDGLTDGAIAAPAPFSPTNDPDETVGSLLAGLLFHEAYHAGQLGVIRRTLGVPGAVTPR